MIVDTMADARGTRAMNSMSRLVMTEGIEMDGAIGEEALSTRKVMAGAGREKTHHLHRLSSTIHFCNL